MKSLLIAVLAAVSLPAQADPYHYKSFLIGGRAVGLGGAFVAIADDPSGIFYNPAGTAFSEDTYISISTNSFRDHRQDYLDVFDTARAPRDSQTFVPSFIGSVQSIGRLRVGAALMVPEAESFHNRNQIQQTVNGSPELVVLRTVRDDTSYYGGGSVALEVLPNLSLGFSGLFYYRFAKSVDNNTREKANKVDQIQQVHTTRLAFGGIPILGAQYVPIPQLSLGLSASYPFNWGGFLDTYKLSNRDELTGNTKSTFEQSATASSKFQGDLPLAPKVSLGVAYFFSPSLLVTTQLDYHGVQDDYYFCDPAPKPNEDCNAERASMRAVLNWSLGAEFYPFNWLSVRGGVYSDKARTLAPEVGRKDQPPQVDLLGYSLGLSFHRGPAAISLSASYASGEGKGQVSDFVTLNSAASIVNVREYRLVYYLSGSYQL